MYQLDQQDLHVDETSTRRKLLQTLGGLGLVGLAGCMGSGAEPNSKTTTATTTIATAKEVTDATGRTVSIPSNVEDVVAVGPGALNLVAYLDAIDMIVGVEENEHSWGRNNPYNIAHPELQDRPVIGPHKGGDPELIADVDPDVVLATYFTAGTADDLQGKIEVPVVIVKASSRSLHRLEKMFEDLQLVADIIGKPDRAESVVEFFETERNRLESRTEDIPEAERDSVYYAGRSDSGGAGATSTQRPFAPISFVNADNVAESITGHATVSEEKLLTWDPDVIFLAESNLDQVKEALSAGQYSDIQAIKDGEVYGLLPTRFYGNLHGSSIANAYYVGSVLNPNRFEDVDPTAKADEIYDTLLGTGVYDRLAEKFGGFKKITLTQ